MVMSMKVVGSPSPTFYTALYRRKGSRMFYRCGYRSESLNDISEMAHRDVEAGMYAAAKVIDATSCRVIETI